MTEFEIFLRLHDLKDPGKVVRLLHEWCGDDQLARSRIMELLDCHAQVEASEFLKTPAAEVSPTVISAGQMHGADSVSGLPASWISNTMVGDTRTGRYRLLRILGHGNFATVHLAFDEALHRQVAVKVPRKDRFRSSAEAERYLAEARIVARLDHPHIVTVFDVGQTDDGSVYVVSRFIDGCTLAERLKTRPLEFIETVVILETVSSALQHAHAKRLIHRDIKPANILIEEATGFPFVADFGIAISEEDFLKETSIFGTPSYMSPEQARGEGHRLDGRSDIFSMGGVFYEMLTGHSPFPGPSPVEIIHKVIHQIPEPPRNWNPDIPAELERICLKMLSKRASDRYGSCAALIEDLKAWQNSVKAAVVLPTTEVTVIPRGLRSFEASDAGFFLDLLPGVRDRKGLPQSIAFWKNRIEQTVADETFAIGLLYGPSGCGKSSLVKAGLLPNLSGDIVAIYVEATPDDTEARILRGFRKSLPAQKNQADAEAILSGESPRSDEMSNARGSTLVETFTAIRRESSCKVVIIIDQFEQWLHAHRTETVTELVTALRQCDGGRLQAIVMVRDDFAMAASRFMRALDTPIVEGQNFATVDLFDMEHARKVLIRFGQAFGKVPADLSELNDDCRKFVSLVVSSLSEDGLVVPIRLALFAEMVKAKPWTPATLEQVGGTDGVGVNFLEETFEGRSANPDHRRHAAAARAVLKALLPEVGTDIRGGMKSQLELQSESGYQPHPTEFVELLRILDGDLRLITPTAPEGDRNPSEQQRTSPRNFQATASSSTSEAAGFFQLTHDYLVPSLREWLTRGQKQTRKGRAELKLDERSELWNNRKENRHLPSFTEWISIRTLTDSRRWTERQLEMMACATRRHLMNCGFAVALLSIVLAAAVVIQTHNRQQREAVEVEGMVARLLTAAPAELPAIVDELGQNRQLADPLLFPLTRSTDYGSRQRLHVMLALASRDETLVPPLLEALLTNPAEYVEPICDVLRPCTDQVSEELWRVLRDMSKEASQRFRAGLSLAYLLKGAGFIDWTNAELRFLADQLVAASPERQPLLRDLLRHMREQLIPELEAICYDGAVSENQRMGATNALADYAALEKLKLTKLLIDASSDQYGILYPLVSESPDTASRDFLFSLTPEIIPERTALPNRLEVGRRRAVAAITLLRQGERESIYGALRCSHDMDSLTQFVARCRSYGVTARELLQYIERYSDFRKAQNGAERKIADRVLYGLLLTLGNYSAEEIPSNPRREWMDRLIVWYATDPSAAVHSACGWLLRQWNRLEDVTAIDQTPVPYDSSGEREWFIVPIGGNRSDATRSPEADNPLSCLTFVVVPAGDYEIGCADGEPFYQVQEKRRRVRLTRPVAVCDRELTWEAYDPCDSGRRREGRGRDVGRPLADTDPVFGITWYEAVSYCRWLSEKMGLTEDLQCYANPMTPPMDDETIRLDRPGIRLPTEAEWEVVCRGDLRTAYSFGNDFTLLRDYGWFEGNAGDWLHPVGQLRPGPGGLFDIHGNVAEWCHDWADDVTNISHSIDPVGPASGVERIYRGGAWNGSPMTCGLAARSGDAPSAASLAGGFRVVMTLTGDLPDAIRGPSPASVP